MPDIESIQQLLASYPQYLGAAIGLIAFIESFAILGILVPGVALLATAAFVAGTGALGMWTCLLLAFTGAVLGDGVSFLIGRIFHGDIKGVRPFATHPQWIEQGERFFATYGAKSVVAGRFIGPVRPIIPMVAGMLGMRGSLFLLINLLSALVWAPVYILPGFLLGAAVESRFASPGVLSAGVLLGIGLIWFFHDLHRRFRD